MAVSVYKWLLVAGFLSLVSWSGPRSIHPYYISVVEIDHNAPEKTLEISCKIFTNDFEKTLSQNYKTKVDLIKPADRSAMDKLIIDYIKKHLGFKVDGKALNYSYLGYEKEDEAIYSYWQIENISSLKKLEINDSILHDFSDQQINIIHFIVNGKRQSTKLDYPNSVASFSL